VPAVDWRRGVQAAAEVLRPVRSTCALPLRPGPVTAVGPPIPPAWALDQLPWTRCSPDVAPKAGRPPLGTAGGCFLVVLPGRSSSTAQEVLTELAEHARRAIDAGPVAGPAVLTARSGTARRSDGGDWAWFALSAPCPSTSGPAQDAARFMAVAALGGHARGRLQLALAERGIDPSGAVAGAGLLAGAPRCWIRGLVPVTRLSAAAEVARAQIEQMISRPLSPTERRAATRLLDGQIARLFDAPAVLGDSVVRIASSGPAATTVQVLGDLVRTADADLLAEQARQLCGAPAVTAALVGPGLGALGASDAGRSEGG
jgi:hypothetical protein